jgi:stage III sporulation protein SpoIIIAA
MSQRRITDDLQALLGVLPAGITQAVKEADDSDNLLERTLHRIAAIRNRRGHIVGLTCRVGRAVYGTTDIIKDLIESDKSLLLLGRPGVGKTTMLREAARLLAESKRVVIVDTSNEIGGDGDVPHPAVGRARRMQVTTPSLQHEVMIEAVENHNPEAIVIDEIGRELEAEAARTIAERGVQLIGTAHGNTLENLLLNPTLSDLVGGIESVTLSDEEARRRGTQKTVLERRGPPTFDVLIEIQTRDRLAVHRDVASAVDALLRGYPQPPEIRSRDEGGEIRIERAPQPQSVFSIQQGARRPADNGAYPGAPVRAEMARGETARGEIARGDIARGEERPESFAVVARMPLQTTRIYAYGVARNRLSQAAKRLNVPVVLANDVDAADVLVTLRSYYRKRQRAIVDAENRGMPIYVLRANTINQMQQFLGDLFNLSADVPDENPEDYVREETMAAINAVLNGERWVELQPAASSIRRLQHQMARQANLLSHSYGKEPRRRVRIFRE